MGRPSEWSRLALCRVCGGGILGGRLSKELGCTCRRVIPGRDSGGFLGTPGVLVECMRPAPLPLLDWLLEVDLRSFK